MIRFPENWPKLAFIFVPLLILLVNAVVLVVEGRQPDTQKAIRLVKESNSRKENFTIQQYLYTTVYYRQSNGEEMTIDGWQAAPASGPDQPLAVEFSYADSQGRHVFVWEVSLKDKSVTPNNETAVELSWH